MGQSQSSAASGAPADSTKHVFTAATPINFSAELIDSLANSSETNSTRAKSLDLHIAQRVHEELARLQSSQDSAVEAARKKILSVENEEPNPEQKSTLKDSVKAKLPESIGGGTGDSDAKKDGQTSKKVQEEIQRLKKELGQRKVMKELPKSLEAAREDVIGCLRVNDRRPLDCWKEVEIFKREVRRLEDDFVGRVL
jgi:MICOS complex subunit MIC19